jgi:hypothetical protein
MHVAQPDPGKIYKIKIKFLKNLKKKKKKKFILFKYKKKKIKKKNKTSF